VDCAVLLAFALVVPSTFDVIYFRVDRMESESESCPVATWALHFRRRQADKQAGMKYVCYAVLLCLVRSDLLFVVCCRYAPRITKTKQNVF
jgi:hypothetical protein